MGEPMANVAVAAAVLLCGLSLLLFVVGAVSYQRLRHPRLLWVSLAFAVLLAKGIHLARLAYAQRGSVAGGDMTIPILAGLDLAIAACLYFAVLKR